MTSRSRFLCLLTPLLAHCASNDPSAISGFIDAPIAAVAAPVSGQVADVAVHEGQRVTRGQLLARLDTRERAALVAEAEANVAHAREAVHEAEHDAAALTPTVRESIANVARQQAELDDATAEFRRMQRLMSAGAISASEMDTARARLDQARAALESLGASRQASRGRVAAAMAAVDTARAAQHSAEAALELARVQLAETEIRSPFDGLVAEQDLQPGEWAAPGTPVVTVEDWSQLWVRIDVDESHLGQLRVGQPARIRVIAFPGRTYTGRVIEIGAEAEFALNRDVKRGRPDVRTFRVRVRFDGRHPELRPGMSAEVVPSAPRGSRR